MNTEAILSELRAQRDRIDRAIAALDSRTMKTGMGQATLASFQSTIPSCDAPVGIQSR
jgi:hypothetical protein